MHYSHFGRSFAETLVGVLQKRGSPSCAAVKWGVTTDRRPVRS